MPFSRWSVATPSAPVAAEACAPTVTVAPAITFSGVAPASTTVTLTGHTFASERSTVAGSITPCSSTLTGTVTTLSPFATVTVPAVGRGTSGTAAWPSLPVVASCFFPSLPTMVTVAPATLAPLSVTVTATGDTSNSAATVTSAAGIVNFRSDTVRLFTAPFSV